MNKAAKNYIEKLRLQPHPEGGYYREVYRSEEIVNSEYLPDRYGKSHAFATSIYFLLEGDQVSVLHRLKSDEIWHFYDGSTIDIYIFDQSGKMRIESLGKDLNRGECSQVAIPKGHWFGAELKDKNSFAFIGCTVAPGFEFEDFEIGDKKFLLKLYPEYSEIIKKLTKLEI
jgi:uncharacterized protein